MKTIKTIGITFVVTITLFAAMAYRLDETPNAVAEKVNGIDVYIYCKPSIKYAVIKEGTIVTVSMRGIDGVVNSGTKTAAKENADGVIINARNGKYQAIKYE